MMESTAKQPNSAFDRAEHYEIDLKAAVNLVKHSYKLIVLIVSIFLLYGIHYAQTRPPVYRSSAMIEMSNNAVGGLGNAGGVGSLLQGLGSSSSSSDIETVLLQSPYILGDVVSQLGLDISVSPHSAGFWARHLARFKPMHGNAAISILKVPNELLSRPLLLVAQDNNHYSLFNENGEKILDGVVGQLTSANYLSQPVQIQVTSLNAEPGTKFDIVKQPISDVADDLSGGLAVEEVVQGTGILTLSYTSGDPEEAQKLLSMILAVAVEKSLKDKSAEAAKTAQFLSKQIPISEKHFQDTEEKLDQYSIKSGIFDMKAAGPAMESDIQTLQDQLDKLQFKKTIMLEKFMPIHPLIIALTEQENHIKQKIAKEKEKLQSLPTRGEKEISLQQDATIQTGIYTALVESAQNMEMLKASRVSGVRVLSAASYPTSRIPVKKFAIIGGSGFLGFVVALAIVLIRHVLSPVIENPDVVERALGVAVTAIIPCSQRQLNYNKKIKRNKFYANTHPFLLAHENPHDVAIEGIRSLRTTIQMALIDAKNNVIAVTGCSPGVGKSFISSNLSALLSDTGKRLLIIDADIRLGKLNQCFGKLKAPGLSTYLQKEATLEQIIQTIQPGKLDFISTGLYPEQPSELFLQNTFLDLINTLKTQYDLVLIDTPPVLAVTDPSLILRHSSISLMVLGVGKDQLKEVIYAKNILEKSGVILTGVVFNTLQRQKPGFGYNYGYNNYYYAYDK